MATKKLWLISLVALALVAAFLVVGYKARHTGNHTPDA